MTKTTNQNQLNLFDLFSQPPEEKPEQVPKYKPDKKQSLTLPSRKKTEPLKLIINELTKIEQSIKDNINLIWDININTGKNYYHAIAELKNLLQNSNCTTEDANGVIKVTIIENILTNVLYSIFRKPTELLTQKNINEIEFFKSNLKFYPDINTLEEVTKTLGRPPEIKLLKNKKVIVYFIVDTI